MIKLQLQIEGYSTTVLVLDTKRELVNEEQKMTMLMKDSAGRKLNINV